MIRRSGIWLISCWKMTVRNFIAALVILQSVGLLAVGKLAPLALKDIDLMLRSGYSAAAVQEEVAARHFMETIDAAAEKSLVKAGATTALVDALKSGRHAIPAGEIAAVQADLAVKEKRRAMQAEESNKLNTLQQARTAPERTASPGVVSHVVAAAVKGGLVTARNGVLTVFNDQALEKKKLIALYFSARWCGPCRKFTPELVEYYNRVTPAHPEFEIVFVSADRSEPAMQAYMNDFQMPWPALQFDKVAANTAIRKYAGQGIPCLVLLDGAGKVLSDSYAGGQYLGPQKVLADLDKMIFANAGARGTRANPPALGSARAPLFAHGQ